MMIIKAFNKTFDLDKTDCVTNNNLLIELSEKLTNAEKLNNDLIKVIEKLIIDFTEKQKGIL
jgi:hypothetical protein